MIRGLLLAAFLAAQEPPAVETVAVPGTPVKFDLVRVPASGLQPFWMGKCEVTWREFNLFYDTPDERRIDGVTRPSEGRSFLGQAGIPNGFQDGSRPVTNLKWHAAVNYCEWLSKKTGHAFRLPTEREWESACGPAPRGLDDAAWHAGNSGGRTHAGGEKAPNAFGLHDMLGNVWEYCLEPRDPPDYSPVLRGGAWNVPSQELRADRRQTVPYAWVSGEPNTPRSMWWLQGDFSQGFRVVRAADAGTRPEREAAAAKVEVRILKNEEHVVRTGEDVQFFERVAGEVRNAGDRAIGELELTVYYLDPKGRPHFKDLTGATKPGRATFSKCWPVLPNSFHAGAHREPLQPGGVRAFAVDLPQTCDGPDDVQAAKFGARAAVLRLGPKP